MTRHTGSQRIRWSAVVPTMLTGLALIGLAYKLEASWNWQGVSPGLLINVGTALLLVGVLFLLERRFVKDVAKEASSEARAVARQETRELAATLTSRLDQIQDQVNQRLRQQDQEQDAAVAALTEHVSYPTVTEALTEANKLNALHQGEVTVQASDDPDGARLTFRWGFTYTPSARTDKHLEITGVGVNVQWRPTQSPTDVATEIAAQMRQRGIWQGPDSLNMQIAFDNLQRTLQTAIASRRGDPNAPRLHGPLRELVGEDWAITGEGLEALRHQFMLSHTQFPFRRDVDPNWPPEPPDWTDRNEYERAIRRAEQIHPLSRLAFEHGADGTTPPRWQPWAGDETPPDLVELPISS